MLKIQTGSSSCVIVLHEIYGINLFIQDICESLSRQNFDVVCPNLLPHDKKSFDVNEMVVKLDKPNVEIEVFDAQHGFCDPYATEYDKALAQITFMKTVEFFRAN